MLSIPFFREFIWIWKERLDKHSSDGQDRDSFLSSLFWDIEKCDPDELRDRFIFSEHICNVLKSEAIEVFYKQVKIKNES